MLFNSLTFCLFLPLVFALYWFACGRTLFAILEADVSWGRRSEEVGGCVPVV